MSKTYGKAYSVVVHFNKYLPPKREVTYVHDNINFDELNKHTIAFGEQEIFDALYRILHNMCDKYNKSIDDIAETFVKVSGDLEAMRNYLEGKRVTEWSQLEDLALTKDESSNDYSILVKTKGVKEIEKRKAFLNM